MTISLYVLYSGKIYSLKQNIYFIYLFFSKSDVFFKKEKPEVIFNVYRIESLISLETQTLQTLVLSRREHEDRFFTARVVFRC